MTEESNVLTTLDRGGDPSSKAVDKMCEYVKLYEEKVKELNGIISPIEVQIAMLGRDRFGKPMTSTTVIEDYVSPETMEVIRETSRLTTGGAVVDIQSACTRKGSYQTMTLKFAKAMDPDRLSLLKVLKKYFEESNQDSSTAIKDGVPNLSILCVPLSLGGKYGVLLRDPVCFWPEPDDSSESCFVKILFESSDVEFLHNPDFDPIKAVRQIRSELISQSWDQDLAKKRARDQEEYEEMMRKKIAENNSGNIRKAHSFNAGGLSDEYSRIVSPKDRR